MAKGPRHRRPFRRRVEGKTNYHRRLKLLKSRMPRVVIRVSNNHVVAQIIESKRGGDKVLVSAHSKELSKTYGWKANTGNIPAAYLTGYLLGLRGKKNNIGEAVLDLGIFYHRNRVLAVVKGVLASNIEIPHDDKFFPESLDNRINGSHIEQYAKSLKSDEPEKYEAIFSGYIKKDKINPMKISQMFSSTLKTIENKA